MTFVTPNITAATNATKTRKPRTYNSGLPSVTVNLNRAAAAEFRDGERVLVTVEEGVLKLKPSKRDDANVVTAKLTVKPCGAAKFKLNQYALTRLLHLYGPTAAAAVKVGTRFTVATGTYRWLVPTEGAAGKVSVAAAK